MTLIIFCNQWFWENTQDYKQMAHFGDFTRSSKLVKEGNCFPNAKHSQKWGCIAESQ